MAKKKKEGLFEEQFLEEDVYTEEGRESQLDNDEIDAWEAGFMEGYDEE